MKKLLFTGLAAITVLLYSCSPKAPARQKVAANFVLVKGGVFINKKSKFYGKPGVIPNLYVGKYEVTQKEWVDVMQSTPSKFKGDNLPVETVNWYDCIEYCNKLSIKDGLKPCYQIDKKTKDPNNTNRLDTLKWIVQLDGKANGYRLLTDAEWEYAAGGGELSKNYTYSGSNDVNEVAWYWQNSGDKYLTGYWSWAMVVNNHNQTKPVGSKKPNELGLYDMSGNVREWCWDWQESNVPDALPGRTWKGGGWMGGDFCCAASFIASYEASGKGADQGFRICRGI